MGHITVYKSTNLSIKWFWRHTCIYLYISGFLFLQNTLYKLKIMHFASSLGDFPIIFLHFIKKLVLQNTASSLIKIQMKWTSHIFHFNCPQMTHSCHLKRRICSCNFLWNQYTEIHLQLSVPDLKSKRQCCLVDHKI